MSVSIRISILGMSKVNESLFVISSIGIFIVSLYFSVRQCAVDQFLLMATKCSSSPHTLVVFIVMLFNQLNGQNTEYSKEYFQVQQSYWLMPIKLSRLFTFYD